METQGNNKYEKGFKPPPRRMRKDIDSRALTFGKYKGQTPDDISESDPSYIVWLWDNVPDPPVSRALYLACSP